MGALQRRGLASGVPDFKVSSNHSLTAETNTWHFVVLLPQLSLQCHFRRQLHCPPVWISWIMNPKEIHSRIPQWIFQEAEASSHMQSNWCALSYAGKPQVLKEKKPQTTLPPKTNTNQKTKLEPPSKNNKPKPYLVYTRFQNSNDAEFSWFLQIFT